MATLLIRRATAIMTGLARDRARASGTDIRLEDGVIAAVGRLEPHPGEEVIDASGCVIYPGWVNTHHHLSQTLLKGVPAGINAGLAEWLMKVPFRYRERIDAEMLETAATVGIAQLILSGCTTIADHHYLFYPGMPFDGSEILFRAAERFGIRFVLCRGGTTRARPGQEQAASPSQQPETAGAIVADVERLVARWHDAGPLSFRRVVMAPPSPHYGARPEDLAEFARAARRLGIRLHTHLSENLDYLRYFREVHNLSPVEFLDGVGWLGPDVWFAHLVHVSDEEIALLAKTGTGVAHCPGSNCRLGSGVAPAPKMAAAGMPVSLGVDGSAANEPGDMLSEVRLAWLVHRGAKGAGGAFDGGADAVTLEDVVQWGTSAGAGILGLGTGAIVPGRAADLALYEIDEPRYFGLHDPALAPVLGGGQPRLRRLICGGRTIVQNGLIAGLDTAELGTRARRAVARLVQ